MVKQRSDGLAAIYEIRRQHTVAMTSSAIEAVKKAAEPISLSAIVAASRHIDPTGKGVSCSAILRNPEAYSLYKASRAWRAPLTRHRRSSERRNPFKIPVKVGRSSQLSRRRLSRLTKSELIEQLIEIEDAYATVRAAWVALNGQLLSRGSKSVRGKHIHSEPA
jgi:hypothetical protein